MVYHAMKNIIVRKEGIWFHITIVQGATYILFDPTVQGGHWYTGYSEKNTNFVLTLGSNFFKSLLLIH